MSPHGFALNGIIPTQCNKPVRFIKVRIQCPTVRFHRKFPNTFRFCNSYMCYLLETLKLDMSQFASTNNLIKNKLLKIIINTSQIVLSCCTKSNRTLAGKSYKQIVSGFAFSCVLSIGIIRSMNLQVKVT